jgi:hypothetical protein
MMPRTTASVPFGEVDKSFLIALNTFYYLTAAQASRLLYPNLKDKNRYASRRLKKLVDQGFVLRLRDLPKPLYGAPPHVFTLTRRGRQYLERAGYETPSYFRPSEEEDKAFNHMFMDHTLASIDVLIAAKNLCREYPVVSCPRLIGERELKHNPSRVDVPAAPGSGGQVRRNVAVIPDGWFQLAVGSEPPDSIALELDRGTEDQKAWRRKVAALVTWANGPYREAFETDNITIAVVAPNPTRRDQLREWTARELAHRDLVSDGQIFLFTSADPVETSPSSFFLGSCWYLPRSASPLPLLDVSEVVGVGEAPSMYA